MESEAQPRSVLVVCFGNLCRSPMAEGLLRHKLGPEWAVASAGTNAYGGDPPTETACLAIEREFRIDISEQRSTPLTVGSIRRAAHVLTMSVEQARLATALDPTSADRIRLLGAFAPAGLDAASLGSADPGGAPAGPLEIADPMGGELGEYVGCLARLDAATDRCVAWLASGAPEESGPASVGSPRWPFAHSRA